MSPLKAFIVFLLTALFVLLQCQNTIAICQLKPIKKSEQGKKLTENSSEEEEEESGDEDSEEEGDVKLCNANDAFSVAGNKTNFSEGIRFISKLHNKHLACFSPPPELK